MRPKQKLAAFLAFWLIVLNLFPTFAVSAEDLQKSEATIITPGSGLPSATSSDADVPSHSEEDETTEDVPELQSPSDAKRSEIPVTGQGERNGNPVFCAELVEDGENPGLYGTLSFIPEDVLTIRVQYSLDGVEFDDCSDVEPLTWDTAEPEEPQLCLKNSDMLLQTYLAESVNTLYIRLSIVCSSMDIVTQPIKLTHGKTWPIPEMPLAFSARIVNYGGGYQIRGHFSDFPPDVIRIRPIYSIDGEIYRPVESNLRWDMRIFGYDGEVFRNEDQLCMTGGEEPLKSYLSGSLTQFYLKLELTKETGETYCTQTVRMNRSETVLVPEDAQVYVRYAANMRNGRPSYGKYQVTVAEGMTWAQVHTFLPQTIPLEVQIFLPDAEGAPALGTVEASVEWELPDGSAAVQELTDAATVTVLPDQIVTTPLGTFQLRGAPEFDMEYSVNKLKLVPNVITEDAVPTGALNDNDRLEMAFNLKPTGATAIHTYYFVENGDKWVELPDIPLLEAVDGQPRFASTDYVTVLRANQEPYRAWRSGELECFWIGIKIEGGIYDGKSMVLAWPDEYELPPDAPNVDGSGGNENNAGNGDGNGGSAGDGGQRPNLPDEETPPVNLPELSDSPDYDGEGSDEGTSPPVIVNQPEPYISEPPQESARSVDIAQAGTEPLTSSSSSAGQRISAPPKNTAIIAETASEPLETARPPASEIPAWNNQTESPAETNTRKPSESKTFPVGVTAAILVGGVAAAFTIGAAGSGAVTASKIFNALRKLIFRK